MIVTIKGWYDNENNDTAGETDLHINPDTVTAVFEDKMQVFENQEKQNIDVVCLNRKNGYKRICTRLDLKTVIDILNLKHI